MIDRIVELQKLIEKHLSKNKMHVILRHEDEIYDHDIRIKNPFTSDDFTIQIKQHEVNLFQDYVGSMMSMIPSYHLHKVVRLNIQDNEYCYCSGLLRVREWKYQKGNKYLSLDSENYHECPNLDDDIFALGSLYSLEHLDILLELYKKTEYSTELYYDNCEPLDLDTILTHIKLL